MALNSHPQHLRAPTHTHAHTQPVTRLAGGMIRRGRPCTLKEQPTCLKASDDAPLGRSACSCSQRLTDIWNSEWAPRTQQRHWPRKKRPPAAALADARKHSSSPAQPRHDSQPALNTGKSFASCCPHCEPQLHPDIPASVSALQWRGITTWPPLSRVVLLHKRWAQAPGNSHAAADKSAAGIYTGSSRQRESTHSTQVQNSPHTPHSQHHHHKTTRNSSPLRQHKHSLLCQVAKPAPNSCARVLLRPRACHAAAVLGDRPALLRCTPTVTQLSKARRHSALTPHTQCTQQRTAATACPPTLASPATACQANHLRPRANTEDQT